MYAKKFLETLFNKRVRIHFEKRAPVFTRKVAISDKQCSPMHLGSVSDVSGKLAFAWDGNLFIQMCSHTLIIETYSNYSFRVSAVFESFEPEVGIYFFISDLMSFWKIYSWSFLGCLKKFKESFKKKCWLNKITNKTKASAWQPCSIFFNKSFMAQRSCKITCLTTCELISYKL